MKKNYIRIEHVQIRNLMRMLVLFMFMYATGRVSQKYLNRGVEKSANTLQHKMTRVSTKYLNKVQCTGKYE